MTLRIAVVYEASADFVTATELADRAIVEAIDWLDDEAVIHHRIWLPEVPTGPLTWKNLKRMARDANIRSHGKFYGESGLPDAVATRRAIDFLMSTGHPFDGIVLIRDQDDQPERRGGLEQARLQTHHRVEIVIGLAVVERENWVVCGFDHQNDAEFARLEAERTRLGFDPCSGSHRLTDSKADNAAHSPKRVLKELTGDDPDRERRCWRETILETLRRRGSENGLAAFLFEVRNRLASLFGYVARSNGER